MSPQSKADYTATIGEKQPLKEAPACLDLQFQATPVPARLRFCFALDLAGCRNQAGDGKQDGGLRCGTEALRSVCGAPLLAGFAGVLRAGDRGRVRGGGVLSSQASPPPAPRP